MHAVIGRVLIKPLFDGAANARAAEAMFNTLREMPEAPAIFVSVDVCEVVGQA